MASFEVESEDVVRLVLQFLKENKLLNSMRALQEESKVSLNTVDNLTNFAADINHGRWEVVLPAVSALSVPTHKLVDLYEQMVKELLELREIDMAKEIVRTAEPFNYLKQEDPERFLKLEHWIKRGSAVDPRDYYSHGSSREKRRAEIADALLPEVGVVPPSRLLALISQSLKWQQMQGLLPHGQKYDLFRGDIRLSKTDIDERPPRKSAGQIRFGSKSYPESVGFSPDGQHLVSGSVDGFVEVWDHNTCKLRKDLAYQAKDELMMHDEPVISQGFSRDGELLATGCKDGSIKIWKIATGQCMRKFKSAHSEGITAISFSRDGSHVLSCSFDHMLRIHGLKSGRMLREFRGHESFVHTVAYSSDGAKVMSGSSDGSVRVWDSKTAECLFTFKPTAKFDPSAAEIGHAVHTVMPMPGSVDHLLVSNRTTTAFLCTIQGQCVRNFESSGKHPFVAACASPKGQWLYCAASDGTMHCFDVSTGELKSELKVCDKDVLGLAHHPHRNLIATYSDEGVLKLWKA
ncbi:unnamed protein product [Chrysoparadoxa australica]